jgi:SAM-dependent methyltransferase
MRLVNVANVAAGERVLDIACGRGAVLFPAVDQVGDQGFVEGIDLALPMVEQTAADIARRGLTNARVRRMDAEHLDFPDRSFDVVLCGFALWFIPDLQGALAEIRRVSKIGGRFAATTWAASEGLQRAFTQLLREFGSGGDVLASHSLSTADSLTEALQTAGFHSVEASYEEQTSRYANQDEWWDITKSSPQLDSLSQDQRLELESRALDLARGFNEPTGLLVSRRYVLGRAVSG